MVLTTDGTTKSSKVINLWVGGKVWKQTIVPVQCATFDVYMAPGNCVTFEESESIDDFVITNIKYSGEF